MTDVRLVLATCPDRDTITIVTPLLEAYSLTYCPEGTHSTMRAIQKTILFAKVTHDRKVHQWPVAVFAKADDARAYATFLRLAYRAKDDASIAALDPSHARDAEAKPLYEVKWSMLTVPYSPLPELDSDDNAVKDETPTA